MAETDRTPAPAKAGAPDSVGVTLRRSPRLLGIEPFIGEFINGMESVLSTTGRRVLLQVVPSLTEELATYRRWADSRQVVGVALRDIVENDPRIAVLAEVGLPTVVLGEPATAPEAGTVRVDNYGAMIDAVDNLAALGHRIIGRVSGPAEFIHTRARASAFDDIVAARALVGRTIEGDYTELSGRSATMALLSTEQPPTAIVFDNDVMALGGLAVAAELAVSVPGDLSLLAWDDSVLCRMAEPPLSAMSHDVHSLGALAARSLIEILDGARPIDRRAVPPRFIARGTTAVASGLSPIGSASTGAVPIA